MGGQQMNESLRISYLILSFYESVLSQDYCHFEVNVATNIGISVE